MDASGGSNAPVQSALNSSFNNNNISGNWYGQIVDRQSGGSLPTPGSTNLKNFECNWYGSASPVVSTSNSTEPPYTTHIPVYLGGTASDPGGQPDILGPASANFIYYPFLNDGTDDDGAITGFQPIAGTCAACPDVTVVNINSGITYCSLQAAIDDATTNPGDTLMASAGTYFEDLLVNKADLVIIGAGIDQTIIDHSGQSGHNNAGVHILANGIEMKDLTVTGNSAVSVPRYGLKVGTSSVTTDDVVLDSVKVTNSFRTGFDLARPKNLSLKNVFAINNGGAGIFMSNAEGVVLENITTAGNP
ncbi:MAG: right-handed parallel beta-helix repeat-containing protein [Owenweeksia sp.]|nr:right-handed parallel beta-helix repeat-containing protein [Owenweeksia sp.]